MASSSNDALKHTQNPLNSKPQDFLEEILYKYFEKVLDHLYKIFNILHANRGIRTIESPFCLVLLPQNPTPSSEFKCMEYIDTCGKKMTYYEKKTPTTIDGKLGIFVVCAKLMSGIYVDADNYMSTAYSRFADVCKEKGVKIDSINDPNNSIYGFHGNNAYKTTTDEVVGQLTAISNDAERKSTAASSTNNYNRSNFAVVAYRTEKCSVKCRRSAWYPFGLSELSVLHSIFNGMEPIRQTTLKSVIYDTYTTIN